MCDNDTPLKKRRTVMNRVLVVLGVLVLSIGAFEFGKVQERKNEFIQPFHNNWTSFCTVMMNAPDTMCTCMEREMVKEAGRDLTNNTDPTLAQRAVEVCRPD